MFTNFALSFQVMRRNKRKNKEVASTSMEIVKHNSPDKHLKRLRLILNWSTQYKKG